MAKFSLRRFETQAQVSVLLSLLSFLPLASLTFFIVRRFDFKEFIFYYAGPGRMGVLISAACTLLLATAGFGLGLNSAGQRRNDKQRLSWLGFFIGAVVLALTVVGVFLFVTRGEQVIK